MQAKELEIIRGIAQAASMGYDGALDDEGKPIKIGLKRDEGNPIVDSRHMDGFKISFKGPILCLKYQTEVKLKDVHQKGFENEIRSTMNSIASFLKKEYKKATKKNLNLTSMGEPKIDIQRISSVRSDLHAFQEFKIGGLTNTLKYGHLESKEENERKIEDSIRKFLELGRKNNG